MRYHQKRIKMIEGDFSRHDLLGKRGLGSPTAWRDISILWIKKQQEKNGKADTGQ
jgi:hypothetical protein